MKIADAVTGLPEGGGEHALRMLPFRCGDAKKAGRMRMPIRQGIMPDLVGGLVDGCGQL